MNKLGYLVAAMAALFSGILVFYTSFYKTAPESALYYQQAREVKNFTFIDHLGQPFSNQQLLGKWSWVFFGYTSCPDVCPTTLQELNLAYDDLKQVADNTQILLVTVDPMRDTQDKLASYIGYFNAEFKALRADHSVLFPFARNLGLMYAITDDTAADSYLVDHSASLVLINPDGNIAAILKPEQEIGRVPTVDAALMVSDFSKIVNLF
jgi:protein SCO1/2